MKNLVGVGPHPKPWPQDTRYDQDLLENGDYRNVTDNFRYVKTEVIIAELDTNGVSLEIAIENLERDFNMGTIVRSANAFGVRHVHIIGRKQWNKRGAMKTETYLHLHYYKDVESFVGAMANQNKWLVAVDIIEGAKNIAETDLPKNTVLIFGSEGNGLSSELVTSANAVAMIPQHGSSRSLNVGVAAGVAMYAWQLAVY